MKNTDKTRCDGCRKWGDATGQYTKPDGTGGSFNPVNDDDDRQICDECYKKEKAA